MTALSKEQKEELNRSACADCSLQVNWLSGDCPHAEDCYAQLTVLFGIAEKLIDEIGGTK